MPVVYVEFRIIGLVHDILEHLIGCFLFSLVIVTFNVVDLAIQDDITAGFCGSVSQEPEENPAYPFIARYFCLNHDHRTRHLVFSAFVTS